MTFPMKIAGFWARTLAFAIDVLILYLCGQLLGLVAFDTLAQLGAWGRLVGLAIGILYFGLLDSRLGGGQTLGKRLLRLVVCDRTGQRLSLPRSAARFLVLGLPWMLNGVGPGPGTQSLWLSMLLSLSVFGLGAALLYLALFNRRQGQFLQDWLCASVVLKKQPLDAATLPLDVITLPQGWRGHGYVVAALLVLSLLLPLLLAPLLRAPIYAELARVQTAVSQVAGVRTSTVLEGQKGKPEPDSPPPLIFLQVVATVDTPARMTPALSAQLAKTTLQALPQAANRGAIVVELRYGYDIGIASRWRVRTERLSPVQWRQR